MPAMETDAALWTSLEVIGAGTETHEEHVEADAELARRHTEHALVLGREQDQFLHVRRHEAEEAKGRATTPAIISQNYLRLLQILLAEPANDAAGRQDDGHLQEET
jgi:hypothetical protein